MQKEPEQVDVGQLSTPVRNASQAERHAMGKQTREACPRHFHAAWKDAARPAGPRWTSC